MTPTNSNILAFPSPTRPVVLARTERKAIHLSEMNKLSADERADYIASIVRSVIGFARRKGARIESLPPQLRAWFIGLCDLGDPTCLVIRDWLSGNPTFTASGEGA